MKFFFSETQFAHQPQQYMVHGRIVNPLENKTRASALIAALAECGLEQTIPALAGLEPILRVHARHFVDFLRTAHADFLKLPNAGAEVLPNVHPYQGAGSSFAPRRKPRPTGIVGRAGWYMGDLSAVIMAGTFSAAVASAESAVAAAHAVRDGAAGCFALCRPPGHHAGVDRAAGFCFFNNAAIAAEILRERFARVAVLDFDTHHGDGTQAIFYRRDDVFFGSVHTDPSAYYPHFVGYAEERGSGKGRGANLNLPLAPGAEDAAFLAANETLLAEAKRQGAEALVLSAGWDAHRLDPLSKLAVSTDAYARLGEIYGRAKLPTVLVQEGGYSLEAIGAACRAFVSSWRAASGV